VFAVGYEVKLKKQLSTERMTRHITETRPKKDAMQYCVNIIVASHVVVVAAAAAAAAVV